MSAKTKIINKQSEQYGSISIVNKDSNVAVNGSYCYNAKHNKRMCLIIFCISLIICIILRFGFYNESPKDLNFQNNNLFLRPFCVKGAIGTNWNNNLLIFGGKLKRKSFTSRFINFILYLNTSNNKWQESFVDLNGIADNIITPKGVWKSDGVTLGNDFYHYGGSTGLHRESEQHTMWKYNLLTKRWKQLKITNDENHPYVRGHCMALYGTQIILFGGKNISGYDQNWIMHFDIKVRQKCRINCCYKIDENVKYVSFLSYYCQNPEQGFVKYDITSDIMPKARQAATCQIIDGKFIVFGGRLEHKHTYIIDEQKVLNKTFSYDNTFWSFDLKTYEWMEIAWLNGNDEQIPEPVCHLSSAVYDTNKFVVTAGHNHEVLRQNWMFDFSTYKWYKLADLPIGYERCLHVGTYINGKGVLIFGGQRNIPGLVGKNTLLNDVLLYEFDNDIWTVLEKDDCAQAKQYWSERLQG